MKVTYMVFLTSDVKCYLPPSRIGVTLHHCRSSELIYHTPSTL